MNKGRQSQTSGDKGILESWHRCRGMKAPNGAEWVPWEAVVVNEKLLPRHIDADVVQRYAGVFTSLPPITVQRGTFVLIDGLHRLRAAPKAPSDVILIREVDVADADLQLVAFESNLSNGLPYTLTERVAGAKLMLQKHPELSNTVIAQRCGIDSETVRHHRHRLEAYSERTLGADGKEYRSPKTGDLIDAPIGRSTNRNSASHGEPAEPDDYPVLGESTPPADSAPAPKPARETRTPEPTEEWEEPSRQVDTETGEVTASKDDWMAKHRICGKVHRGHLSVCRLPFGECDIEDGPGTGDQRPNDAADYLSDWYLQRLCEAVEKLANIGVPMKRVAESLSPNQRLNLATNIGKAAEHTAELASIVGAQMALIPDCEAAS